MWNTQLRRRCFGDISVAAINGAFAWDRGESNGQDFDGQALEGTDRGVGGAHNVDVVKVRDDLRLRVRLGNSL
jgi:hypothetical protein